MNKPPGNFEQPRRSPDNPNGLFRVILDPSFTDIEPDFHRRLAIAAADIQVYVTDVAGVDKDMADSIAARAVQEVLAATAITLEPQEWQRIFAEATRFVEMSDTQ